ncbi:hypothetical protein ACFL6U_17165 [Planctomycetota bacterium]
MDCYSFQGSRYSTAFVGVSVRFPVGSDAESARKKIPRPEIGLQLEEKSAARRQVPFTHLDNGLIKKAPRTVLQGCTEQIWADSGHNIPIRGSP